MAARRVESSIEALGLERAGADDRDRHLRVEGHELESRRDVRERTADCRVAAPRDELVEELGAEQHPLDRRVAAAPVDA